MLLAVTLRHFVHPFQHEGYTTMRGWSAQMTWKPRCGLFLDNANGTDNRVAEIKHEQYQQMGMSRLWSDYRL